MAQTVDLLGRRIDLCYWLEFFHPQCKEIQINYPYVYCADCRVVAHLDLVATRIDASEALNQVDKIRQLVSDERRRKNA